MNNTLEHSSQDAALCPALFIAGIASGQGKTTITAAIARYHRNNGKNVRVFKTGPDYLDPKILEIASGNPVEQLDLWMAGKEYCAEQLYLAAKECDLILIEGAMGLLDGSPSSADLAATFGIPVAVVINARGMAQTLEVFAVGLKTIANRSPGFELTGIIANALGSQRHIDLIEEAMPADVPLLAGLLRNEAVAIPERHLGLVEPSEENDLNAHIDAGARWINGSLTELPRPIKFEIEQTPTPPRLLKGVTIAVAKDEAFSFIYAVNLRCLSEMGASISFFSPLHDNDVPPSDALWLPGGYPELHLKALSTNAAMKSSLESFYNEDKPILAECGGMLAIQQSLTDMDGKCFSVFGLIPGEGELKEIVILLELMRQKYP